MPHFLHLTNMKPIPITDTAAADIVEIIADRNCTELQLQPIYGKAIHINCVHIVAVEESDAPFGYLPDAGSD